MPHKETLVAVSVEVPLEATNIELKFVEGRNNVGEGNTPEAIDPPVAILHCPQG